MATAQEYDAIVQQIASGNYGLATQMTFMDNYGTPVMSPTEVYNTDISNGFSSTPWDQPTPLFSSYSDAFVSPDSMPSISAPTYNVDNAYAMAPVWDGGN